MSGTLVQLGAISPRGFGPRRVQAYVPSAGLAEPRPLVVMFDGQNLFGDAGSFAGGWHAHAAAERIARARAPIVVGIDHGGAARIAELSPGAGFDAFLRAIVDDLLPRLRDRFPIRGAPFIGGSSLGGLASLSAHLRRPDLFAGALAMSPSLWLAQPRIPDAPARSRIYLDIGAREGNGKTRPLVERFARDLHAHGWRGRGERALLVRIDPRGRHHELAWRRRLAGALRFLLA